MSAVPTTTPALRTRYLGLDLAHPLVAAPSPLSADVDGVRALADAGAAAVVLPSLFEEQIERESEMLGHYQLYGAESYAEALDYFPEPETFHNAPDEYLKLIREATAAVDVPVIASLNGSSAGGWTHYASQIEQAGADALELNIYFLATDPNLDAASVEQRYVETLNDVRELVSIPVAVKLAPYFSAMANFAQRLQRVGANGLVLFNRFYQPDIEPETQEVGPHLVLSTSDELRLALRWTAILHGRVPIDIGVTGGVHDHRDVLKAMMAGANATLLASALLRNGPAHLGTLRAELIEWMVEHEYESIEQLRGSVSQRHVADPEAFERANYMRTLMSWSPDPTGADPTGLTRRG